MTTRWTTERAHEWFDALPWLAGPNYAPAYASNQIEMWQADTFDIAAIDRELGWAKKLGLNTVRVFLHDLVWAQDPKGYTARIDQFLDVAAKHGIKPMLVLFDSVWNPHPVSGPQPEPTAGVHNSGWVQGPGADVLKAIGADADKTGAEYKRLKDYVTGVVKAFGNDSRVLMWDIWNEPDNMNGTSYFKQEPPNKVDLVAPLLSDAFDWARSVNPSQPLTSGVWAGDWSKWENMNAVQRVQLEQSDIISFHNYGVAENFLRDAGYMAAFGRPMICTEYMARGTGSTFAAIMPLMKERKIGAMNWGFVQGRTQTHIPWDSWGTPYSGEPALWFHEILRADGTPYRQDEVDVITSLTKDIAWSAPQSVLAKKDAIKP